MALVGCVRRADNEAEPTVTETEDNTVAEEAYQPDVTEGTEISETAREDSEMVMYIGGREVNTQWQNNESVDALRELCKAGDITVEMSKYGGFEQVGELGTELPRNDVQTVTEAGDIVLYSGSNIVVFYGSNSWAYTRLGRITDLSADELIELLSGSDTTITLSIK